MIEDKAKELGRLIGQSSEYQAVKRSSDALNEDKETASNAMVTFMALNTSGIQLIPATIIAVLAAAGSKNPTAIISTTIIATFSGAVAAVTTAKILQRFFPRDEKPQTVEVAE